jgi:hypothetical protein
MFTGFYRGRGGGRSGGRGGGFGLGFRGSSPPWPYVGRGRGGLPRGAYYFGTAAPSPWSYQPQPFHAGTPPTPGYAPYPPEMSKEEELNYMKDRAEAIKKELGDIESRMQDLETEK